MNTEKGKGELIVKYLRFSDFVEEHDGRYTHYEFIHRLLDDYDAFIELDIKDVLMDIKGRLPELSELEKPIILKKIKDTTKFTKQEINQIFELKPDTPKTDSFLDNFQNGMNSFTNFITMAEQFYDLQPYYFDNKKIWWLWDKTKFKWTIVDEVDIMNLIRLSLKNSTIVVNSKLRQEILESLRLVGRDKKPKPSKKTWIQFNHLIIDLETQETFTAEPTYLVTNPIPWDLSESTDTPVMDQIFEQWVGKDEVKSLYQILAYCCLTDYPIHRIFCFIGSGLNGKSKYLELLSKFVGLENGTTTELDVLLTSKFEMCRLYRKLYCLMGETNFAEMNKTSVIKRLTGQDMIPYEFKNKNPFEDYNYAKILIATNNLPTTTDKTDGFYRRWKIIDFPNRFSEKSDILATIPLQEYNNLATKCKNILIELLKNREFNNEGSIEDRKRNFEEKSNPLDKFWKENIILNPYGHIFKTEFKRTLDEWCREKRFRIFSDISISNFMKEKEIEFEKRKAEWVVDDGRTNYFRAWVGISWRTTNAKSQE